MKKLILAVFIVLLMAVGANAQIINTATGLGSPSIKDNNQNQNTNLNTNTDVNTNTNVNTFVPVNTNIQGQQQGQIQGQLQGQIQGQNNGQVISPSQNVEIKSPTPLLSPPSQSVPELNFGNGRLDWNFAKALPKVAIPLYNPNETVVKVLDTTANVKAKNLLPTLLDMVVDQQPLSFSDRLIIIKAEAQKSWNTGGNVGGAGSYLPTSGLAGASGAGSIVPSWGGTKADDLYTIIIVRVAW